MWTLENGLVKGRQTYLNFFFNISTFKGPTTTIPSGWWDGGREKHVFKTAVEAKLQCVSIELKS